MAAELKLDVYVYGKPGEKTPKDGAAYFTFIPSSALPQGVTMSVDGTIDIEKSTESVINVRLKLASLQARWDNKAHNLTFGKVDKDDPNGILWISPNQIKPGGPWNGGSGFSDFRYDHAANAVYYTINKDSLQKGSYAYGLAVKAETLSGLNLYSVRDDPQIKNGNTFSIPWLETFAAAACMAFAIMIGRRLLRLYAGR